jgi:ABC-type multidrug transport system ATPase subunit
VRQLIMDEARSGRTVILASHILDEVEKVCTHVAVLSKGKLLAQGTTSELLKSADVIEIAADNLDKLQSVLEKNTLVKKIVRNGNILELTVDPATPMERITEPVARAGLSATHLLRRATKLESRFLDLIKGDN